MARPIVMILCGPPGSGKSTLCKEKFPNHPVVSTDKYILQWAKERNTTYSEIFKETFQEAERMFFNDIERLQAEGKSFIIDRTNLTIKSRAKMIRLFPKANYQVVAVAFPYVDPSILVDRIFGRPDQPLAPGLVYSMASAYVKPVMAEGFSYILNSEDIL